MLHVAGLDSGTDYRPQFLGSHDAVALAVSRKMATAGGLSEPILRTLIASGKIDASAIRVIAESPPVPEYAWTFRVGLSDALRRRVSEAFLDVDDADVLNLFKAQRFVPAQDADYEVIRDILKALRKASP
jgi:phosphonate transport system substrate-binding protein